METQEPTQLVEHTYEPTAEQADRAAALRKFNRLFVYIPIGFVVAIAIGIVIILLYVAVNPPSDEALLFISGMADVALVLAMLPILIIGAALLALIAYGYTQGRRRGTAPVRQTQRLLWRMDNVAGRVRVRTGEVATQVSRPFISLNGAVTYVKVLMQQIIRIIRRS